MGTLDEDAYAKSGYFPKDTECEDGDPEPDSPNEKRAMLRRGEAWPEE